MVRRERTALAGLRRSEAASVCIESAIFGAVWLHAALKRARLPLLDRLQLRLPVRYRSDRKFPAGGYNFRCILPASAPKYPVPLAMFINKRILLQNIRHNFPPS